MNPGRCDFFAPPLKCCPPGAPLFDRHLTCVVASCASCVTPRGGDSALVPPALAPSTFSLCWLCPVSSLCGKAAATPPPLPSSLHGEALHLRLPKVPFSFTEGETEAPFLSSEEPGFPVCVNTCFLQAGRSQGPPSPAARCPSGATRGYRSRCWRPRCTRPRQS